ncbi:elongation of very long chain fatty acids protein 5-like [Stylophora pistillata]|uniref:Elongation of very long chain fatty acids protein n=1 Tax=Stylophora pistillata TaxID=50429 RepID=A0A2B4RN91_STYPI|nr:elongation of very long chain fatty acids protein 5-like [Stylophora pistillata]PFX17807.1 Elongation of very long chain fatty acids protein 5 [Stylophora pistillata]
MESRAEKYINFFKAVVGLRSFPVVVIYLILIPTSLLWKKYTSPLGLHKVLVAYNFLCSALSLYSFVVIVKAYYQGGLLYVFAMEHDADVKHAFSIYLFTKHLELLDTVFMILRHRQRQITFLHVYHHASILLLSDYACHFCPWPAIGVMLGMNSFVHVFLYLYYGQAALNPTQRPLWKRTMTQLQMVQFVVGIVHSSFGYAHHGFCVYSILYGLSMLGLFGNFYYPAFIRVRREKKSE